MNVYLHELDSVRVGDVEVARGQRALFDELVLKGNAVVLTAN